MLEVIQLEGPQPQSLYTVIDHFMENNIGETWQMEDMTGAQNIKFIKESFRTSHDRLVDLRLSCIEFTLMSIALLLFLFSICSLIRRLCAVKQASDHVQVAHPLKIEVVPKDLNHVSKNMVTM